MNILQQICENKKKKLFLTKVNISKINVQFLKDINNQSRIIVGDIENQSSLIKLINIYVPNGNPINTEK